MGLDDFIGGLLCSPDGLGLDPTRAEEGPQEETCKLLDDCVTKAPTREEELPEFSPSEVVGVGWTESNGSGELAALKWTKGHVLIQLNQPKITPRICGRPG